MPDIDLFKEKLLNLVAKFEKDREHYLSTGYPEAQVCFDLYKITDDERKIIEG